MSKQRQKGTWLETNATRFFRGEISQLPPATTGRLRELGLYGGYLGAFPDAERTGSARAPDGDIDLNTRLPVHVEVKNHKAMQLSDWMSQAVKQSKAGYLPAVIHNRRNYNLVDNYVTMPLWAWTVMAYYADQHLRGAE